MISKHCTSPGRHDTLLRVVLACLALGSLLLHSGCGDSPPPPETVVTGTVTYQGKPVTGGIVYFVIGDGRPYAGPIAEDGTYEVTYIVTGDASIAVDTNTKAGLPTHMELPPQYSSPSRSGLNYTVVEGKQTHDIVLE